MAAAKIEDSFGLIEGGVGVDEIVMILRKGEIPSTEVAESANRHGVVDRLRKEVRRR